MDLFEFQQRLLDRNWPCVPLREILKEGAPNQARTLSQPPCSTEDITLLVARLRTSLCPSALQRTPLRLTASPWASLSTCSTLDVTVPSGSTLDIAPPCCSTEHIALPPYSTEDIAPCCTVCFTPSSCFAEDAAAPSCLTKDTAPPSGFAVDDAPTSGQLIPTAKSWGLV